MKLIGIVLVLISGSSMGVIFNQIQKKRINELIVLQRFMNYLKNEINYAMTPISEAIDLVCAKEGHVISDFFNEFNKKLKQYNQGEAVALNDQLIEELLISSCLEKKDLIELKQFINHLGSRDKASQISQIDLSIENLSEYIGDLKVNHDKNAKLYQSMGVMMGALVVIISL